MEAFRHQKRRRDGCGTAGVKKSAVSKHGLDGQPLEIEPKTNLNHASTAPAELGDPQVGLVGQSADVPNSSDAAPLTPEPRRSKRLKPCRQQSAPLQSSKRSEPVNASIQDEVLDEVAAAIIADTTLTGEEKPRRRKKKVSTEPKPKKISKKAAELIACASQSLKIWSESEMDLALKHLRQADPTLARLLDTPEATKREALLPKGCKNVYSTLTRTIMGQQLATSAARVIYGRFLDLVKKDFETPVVPADVLPLEDEVLKSVGLSRQKTSYLKSLAEHFESGELSDEKIAGMDDQTLITELTKVKGIGRWTVDMFAMFELGHTDVLPVGDLGIRNGMKYLYNLKEAPSIEKMQELTECWRPYRSLGSYFMWHALDVEKKASKEAKLAAKPAKSRKEKTKASDVVTTAVPL